MLSSDENAGRVLVVEDDEAIADVLRRTLRQEGHEVRSSGDGVEALRLAEEFVPDLVVLDLGLPGSMASRSASGCGPSPTRRS